MLGLYFIFDLHVMLYMINSHIPSTKRIGGKKNTTSFGCIFVFISIFLTLVNKKIFSRGYVHFYSPSPSVCFFSRFIIFVKLNTFEWVFSLFFVETFCKQGWMSTCVPIIFFSVKKNWPALNAGNGIDGNGKKIFSKSSSKFYFFIKAGFDPMRGFITYKRLIRIKLKKVLIFLS